MNINKISHEGELNLGGTSILCYVLEDGTRVLSARGMQEALKMVDKGENDSGQSGGRLSRHLEQKTLLPYLFKDKEPDHFTPIECYLGEIKIHGFEATVLADICEAFLEARENTTLSSGQTIIANQCEILIRGFARVDILSLVDEATGYQYAREKLELQKILVAYISAEILKWQKTFPDLFYYEILA